MKVTKRPQVIEDIKKHKKNRSADRTKAELDHPGIISVDSISTKLFYLLPTLNVRLKLKSIQTILEAGKHPVKQLQYLYDAQGPDGFTLTIHTIRPGSKDLPSSLEVFSIAHDRGTEKCLNTFEDAQELEETCRLMDDFNTQEFVRKAKKRNKKKNEERLAAERAAKEDAAKTIAVEPTFSLSDI